MFAADEERITKLEEKNKKLEERIEELEGFIINAKIKAQCDLVDSEKALRLEIQDLETSLFRVEETLALITEYLTNNTNDGFSIFMRRHGWAWSGHTWYRRDGE